jgi:HK97 gp10 family phage protein
MLKSYLPQIIGKLDILTALGEGAAKELEGIIKKELNTGSGTGKVYENDNRLHRASSPGQTPKTDSGDLSKSISSRKTGTGSSEMLINSPYAGALEYGTSKMRPRPFVAPAINELKKRVNKKLKDNWQ